MMLSGADRDVATAGAAATRTRELLQQLPLLDNNELTEVVVATEVSGFFLSRRRATMRSLADGLMQWVRLRVVRVQMAWQRLRADRAASAADANATTAASAAMHSLLQTLSTGA